MFRRNGTTALLVEQNADMALVVADRGYDGGVNPRMLPPFSYNLRPSYWYTTGQIDELVDAAIQSARS